MRKWKAPKLIRENGMAIALPWVNTTAIARSSDRIPCTLIVLTLEPKLEKRQDKIAVWDAVAVALPVERTSIKSNKSLYPE